MKFLKSMLDSKPFWGTCGVINITSIALVLLYMGIHFSAFGMWFYEWQFDVNNTYAVVNMKPTDVHAVTRHMIRYMQLQLDRDYGLQIETVVGGQVRYFFSDLEIRHMVDVWDLFETGFVVRNIAVILLVFTVVVYAIWGRKHLKMLWRSWQIGTIIILTLVTTLGVLIAINWIRVWHYFHYIFFDNDYWLLDPRVDLLVNIVPYDFFLSMAIFIGGVFAGGLIICFIASIIVMKRFKA